MGMTTSDLKQIIKILNKTIKYKDSENLAERKTTNRIFSRLLDERELIRNWQYSYDVLERRLLSVKSHNRALEKTIELLHKRKGESH